MPFGTITVNTKSYEPRQPGVYSLSTVVFGQPNNEFRISGGKQSKDGLLRGSVTRLIEKDVVVNGQNLRKQASVTLSWATPTADFTGSELDGLISDISEFITAATISRINQGES